MKKLFNVLFIVLVLFLFNSNVYAEELEISDMRNLMRDFVSQTNDIRVDQKDLTSSTSYYKNVCIYNYTYNVDNVSYYYRFALSTYYANGDSSGLQYMITPIDSNANKSTKNKKYFLHEIFAINRTNKSSYETLSSFETVSTLFTDEFDTCPTNLEFSNIKSNGGYDFTINTDSNTWNGDMQLVDELHYDTKGALISTGDDIRTDDNAILYCNYTNVILYFDNDKFSYVQGSVNGTVKSSLINTKIKKEYLTLRAIPEILFDGDSIKNSFTADGSQVSCPEIQCGVKAHRINGTATLIISLKGQKENTGTIISDLCKLQEVGVNESNMQEVDDEEYYNDSNNLSLSFPVIGFGNLGEICSDVSGESAISLIKMAKNAVMIVSVVVAIVYSMILFFPVIINDDKDGLSNALKKFVLVIIVLVVILLLPTLVKFIGGLAGLDLSCL